MKTIGAGATRSTTVTLVAASLALAGGVHLGVALEHGRTTRHGLFFLALGSLQVALTALVVQRPSPRLLAVSVATSAVAVTTWAATRLPGFGQRETIGSLDLVATALELLTIGAAASLLRSPVQPRRVRTLRAPMFLVAAAAAALSTNAVPTSHANHHHGHEVGKASVHGPTIEEPIFGDLFADHHAASETAPDEHSDREDSHVPADTAVAEHPQAADGHAQVEPHEHAPPTTPPPSDG